MTNNQVKEALSGEWLNDYINKPDHGDDCTLAKELETELANSLAWNLLTAHEPMHQLIHLLIVSCKFGYAYKCRELELSELERLAK